MSSLPHIHTQSDLSAFLDKFEGELKLIHAKTGRLYFKQLVEKCLIPEIVELQKEESKKVLDPNFMQLIFSWEGRATDPVLGLRIALWKKSLLLDQIMQNPEVIDLQHKLNDAMVTYQYMLGNTKTDLGSLKNILWTSTDRNQRREAWFSKHASSQSLAADLRKLINLRNNLAQEAGFANYPELSFATQGLSLGGVQKMLTELIEGSNPVYKKILADGQEALDLSEIEPWDLMFLLEHVGGLDPVFFPKNGIEPALQKWSKNHGADMQKLGIQMVCTDIPFNGLCMTLDETEIKILTNPSDGHGSYRTMFHELGHALHSAYNHHSVETFRHHESGTFSEGLAEVLAYVTRHPNWLTEMGLNPDEQRYVQKRLIAPWFHYLRERTAYALAEYKIYENPHADADTILTEMEEQILGITHNPTPRWAANAWYIGYPVYWQNYVLADVFASQVHHRLDQTYGGLHGNPEAFAEIRKVYYEPGTSIDWQDMLLGHTGAKLNTLALVEDLHFYLKD